MIKKLALLSVLFLFPFSIYAQTATSLALCLNSRGIILAKTRCAAGETTLNKSNFATAMGLGSSTGGTGGTGGGTSAKIKLLNLADCKLTSASNSSTSFSGENGVAVRCETGRAIAGMEISNDGVQESKQVIQDIKTIYASGLSVGLQAETLGASSRNNTLTLMINCCTVVER